MSLNLTGITEWDRAKQLIKSNTMKKPNLFQAVISGLLFCAVINPVFAVELADVSGPTIVVDEFSDLADVNLEDGICRTSEGGCSLRAAIQVSNLDTDRIRLIEILPGLVKITSSEDEKKPDQGTKGDFEISSSVVIKGSKNAEGELLSGVAGNAFSRIFDILRNNTKTTEVLIQDLLFQDGPNLHNGGVETKNGSIIYSRGNLTLDTVTIIRGGRESNAIFNEGGELEFLNSQKLGNGRAIATEFGNVTIINSRFEKGNMKAGGAALLNNGGVVGIFNSAFVSNGTSAESANAGLGGAIQHLDGVMLIDDSGFSGNQGILGGAIYSTGTLIIKNGVRFNNNTADRTEAQADNAPKVSNGGALYLGEGSAFIRDATFSGNRAERSGGAIYVASAATAQILRSDISNNSALLSGGGVHFDSSTTGSSINQCQINRNTVGDTADGSGGGLRLEGGVVVKNSLVGENKAFTGAGVAASGDSNVIENTSIILNSTLLLTGAGQFSDTAGGVLFKPTDDAHRLTLNHVTLGGNGGKPDTQSALVSEVGKIVLKNSVVVTPADNTVLCSGNIESAGHNVASDASCGLTGAGDKPDESGAYVSLIADNGGVTQTAALPSDSIAIDLVPGSDCLTTDQRLFPRDVANRCDAGAYESGALAPASGALNFLTRNFPRNETAGQVSLTVERTGGSAGAVTVQVVDLLSGDAAAGIDYEFTTQTLSWADGDATPKSFTVTIIDDTNKETETFEGVVFALLNINGPARLGERDLTTLEIIEDDATAFGEFRLAKKTIVAPEIIRDDSPNTNDQGQVEQKPSSIVIEIQRIGSTDEPAIFRYRTSDGTAEDEKDYTGVDSFVTFKAGESSKLIPINILDDDDFEEDETFFFEISNDPSLSNQAFFTSPTRATITIDSEDAEPVDTGPDVRDRTRNATGAVNPFVLILFWALVMMKSRYTATVRRT